MKALIALIVAVSIFFSNSVHAVQVNGSIFHLSSGKVLTIAGEINRDMTSSVTIQLMATANTPGPRIILIRSPGGDVGEGIKIIKLLDEERARTHQKLICVAIDGAHSMAFNIMTHCDVRLATAKTRMVAHKIAIGGDPGVRMTAKNLQAIAKELEKLDRYWAEENAKALHISKSEYDKAADVDYAWSTSELMAHHYLNGIVTISP